MKRPSPWVISVPVISTAHMPAHDAVARLDSPFMIWPDGGMVWVSDVHDDIASPWLREVAEVIAPTDGCASILTARLSTG